MHGIFVILISKKTLSTEAHVLYRFKALSPKVRGRILRNYGLGMDSLATILSPTNMPSCRS